MINPFVDLAERSQFSSNASGVHWLRKLLLVSAVLLAGLLFISPAGHAQVQIADANTELPDYSAYYAALDAREAGDEATALRLFTEAATGGLAIAQYNLGVMYFTGDGVVIQDYQQAYYWTRLAAEQGHVNAMLNLGTLYYNQLGVNPTWMDFWPVNLVMRNSHFAEAAVWYALAAEYDNGEAQYRMATLYDQGTGVAEDKVEALKWALLARDHEINAANALVNTLQQTLTAEENNRAQQAYARWVLEFRG